MISKNRIRFIKSLEQKKIRQDEQLFVIEGEKMVNEALEWIPNKIKAIYYTSDFKFNKPTLNTEIQQLTPDELKSISSLKTPNKALAICEFLSNKTEISTYNLVLDGIQDPGNLGTILRMADWFGISHVICSKDTVDCYNPKVLQATMGSIFRVSISYESLEDFFAQNIKPVYGALLDGKNLFLENFEKEGIIILGNESAESLNVATAGAIILGSVFRGI